MDLADSADQKVVPAVFRSIMGALVPLYAPVAREQGRHTGAARAESVAVKEGEVGSSKIGALVDPDGQLTCEVRLAFWDCWE